MAGGGTGAATLSAGVVIADGTNAFTTKLNPAGAFVDTSSVQNITGGKTFFDQTFKFRDQTNTFTTNILNPNPGIDTSTRLIFADFTNAFIAPQDFHSYIDLLRISAPSNPAANYGRFYVKQTDANNDGVFVKIKRGGSYTAVQVI